MDTSPLLPLSEQQQRRRNNNGTANGGGILNDLPGSDSSKARIFLLVACLWPLCLLALFASSAQHHVALSKHHKKKKEESVTTPDFLDSHVRNLLDRVDILGYGPTHPRIAAVIVGNTQDNLVSSVESLFKHTDLNRIFIVVVVVDGQDYNEELVQALVKIDTSGTIPHWHGSKQHVHNNKDGEGEPHGRKVHVIFNPEETGIAASRADAVTFIDILRNHHEEAGLKSSAEDLLLLLLKSGAQLTSRKWIKPVTEALIVPPPILGKTDNQNVAMKIANAVSFNVEGPGKRTSFDSTFTPVQNAAPTADEINQSNGASYPAPALNGVATAMRLDTFLQLPNQDTTLTQAWPADLDLSLNLWLCADGIDMLADEHLAVLNEQEHPPAPLPPQLAARFAAAWMDTTTTRKFFNAYTDHHAYDGLTFLEWENYQTKARAVHAFAPGLPQKCRSFEWYAKHVNPELADFLKKTQEIITQPDDDDAGAGDDGDDTPDDDEVDGGDSEDEEDFGNGAFDENENDEEQADWHGQEGQGGGDDDDDAKKGLAIPQRNDGKKPQIPLRPENVEIVQKAQPIDTTFVDVSGGYQEHPHLGATYPNGTTYGYIHDELYLQSNPPPFDYPNLEQACAKRDNNYKMLHEKVFVDLQADEAKNQAGIKRDKIFCLVYTISTGHAKIQAIKETWGPKCDGFMVGSNLTDPLVGAVNIVHEGPEEYNNIYQKVRSMWSYIYDHYYEKYDWFHIGGDDLYLIVENLRLYLESEEIKTAANGGIFLPDGTEPTQVPLFLGRRFAYMGDMNDIFNSGGSGYTMNKAALKTLVVKGFAQFFPHAHTFSEDTMVARIFRKFGVYPYDTKDESGGERYMPFLPGHHYGYRMPADHSKDWYAKYSIDIKEGIDHCAARSVAFHYAQDSNIMHRLHALLYHKCPEEQEQAAEAAAVEA